MAITARDETGKNVPIKANSRGDIKVSLSHALPGELASYVRLTTSGVVSSTPVRLVGILASTAGNITLRDQSVSGPVILNAFPVTAGSSISLHNLSVKSCYLSASGSFDVTVVIEPLT